MRRLRRSTACGRLRPLCCPDVGRGSVLTGGDTGTRATRISLPSVMPPGGGLRLLGAVTLARRLPAATARLRCRTVRREGGVGKEGQDRLEPYRDVAGQDAG